MKLCVHAHFEKGCLKIIQFCDQLNDTCLVHQSYVGAKDAGLKLSA